MVSYDKALFLVKQVLCDIENSEFDAVQLMKHHLHDEKKQLTQMQLDNILEDAKKRAGHMPLQYILGFWEFMSLDFYLNEYTLIPRADTEILCESAIDYIKKHNAKAVLDLCAGSGCIGISIAHYCADVKVDLLEISDKACEIISKNKLCNNVEARVINEDIFKYRCDDKYDIIVSNPPYIPVYEYNTLMPEVRDFEPKIALCAQDNGLEFYKFIIKNYKKALNENGVLMFECGYNQADALKEIFAENGYTDIQKIKDYNNIPRVVTGRVK